MSNLIDILETPQNFEEMMGLVIEGSTIRQARTLLSSLGLATNPRIFLSAWLIARFPEMIENSPDSQLQGAAESVVAAMKEGSAYGRLLEVFQELFNAWKQRDRPVLEQEIRRDYEGLSNMSFSDVANQQAVGNMKKTLETTAKRLNIRSISQKINGTTE